MTGSENDTMDETATDAVTVRCGSCGEPVVRCEAPYTCWVHAGTGDHHCRPGDLASPVVWRRGYGP